MCICHISVTRTVWKLACRFTSTTFSFRHTFNKLLQRVNFVASHCQYNDVKLLPKCVAMIYLGFRCPSRIQVAVRFTVQLLLQIQTSHFGWMCYRFRFFYLSVISIVLTFIPALFDILFYHLFFIQYSNNMDA